MSEKQIVFILGMGRSGTSALSRVLSLCGGSLPGELLQADESNPKGHWEPLEALQLNESFLQAHASSWYDPTLRLEAGVIDTNEAEQFIDAIRTLLRTWPCSSFLVIKEPRITALTPFWFDAARREGFAIKAVIPVRHPKEVAASLASRDMMSAELSMLLWLKYNLLAERDTRALPRVFVHYTDLLDNWRRVVGRISRVLGVEFSNIDETAIADFLSRDLHRQRHSSQPVENVGPFALGQIYDAMLGATRDAPLDLGSLDRILQTYWACVRVMEVAFGEFQNRFAPTVPREPGGTDLVWERDALLAQLTGQRQLAEQNATALELLRREYAVLCRTLADARAGFAALHASAETRWLHAEQEAGQLRAELDSILASSSWRLLRPLRAIRSMALRRYPT
jgi:hypothetical protein